MSAPDCKHGNYPGACDFREGEKHGPYWVAYPDDAPPRFNGGIRCDALVGPCACGAWHEVKIVITDACDLGGDD